ncbi:hypothetical protein BGX26_000869 [Mortierella sp. AD094]|nr:hypothetical protein BGX26_000869 [Mortierella sp. AD094]
MNTIQNFIPAPPAGPRNAPSSYRKNPYNRLQEDTKTTTHNPIKADPHLSIASQYKQVIMGVCMSAYHPAVDNQAKVTFSYLKSDTLATCNMIHAPDSANTKGKLECLIPDPDLSHPVSRRMVPEIIGYFQDPTPELHYNATVAGQLSRRSKILLESVNFSRAIPRPSQSATSTDVELAAAFMRSTGSGPIESHSFDGCHYKWASQYQAVKSLSGVGKNDKAISFRHENAKSLEAMHSQVCINRSVVTDRDIRLDPVLREKLFSYPAAYLSDSDWLEVQERERESNQQHWKVLEHCHLSNKGFNAVTGHEKICEVEWQKRNQLIQPAWLCTLDTDERQRLMFATCYGEYGLNSESHKDLMEDEGRRSRTRLRVMIMGCQVDCYDEWASGETNMSSMLCSDCTTAEVRASCSPDYWDSEEYDYIDRWQYAPMVFFFYSARHNYTSTRFLRFQAHKVDDVLKSYGYTIDDAPRGKSNCDLMAAIASDARVEIHDDELSDRISQQYDWAKISGMCSTCSQDGRASDWYLATIGASLAASQLPLLEKIRLAHYLDSTGVNVFPGLHRSYLSGCGCVGRWAKRMGILMNCTSNLWTPANFSTVFALREKYIVLVRLHIWKYR